MNIDPGKVVEEVGSTWKSSPLVVGMQILTIVMVAGLMWDRREQRAQMTPLVQTMLSQIHEQALLLAKCNTDRTGDSNGNVPSSLSQEDHQYAPR